MAAKYVIGRQLDCDLNCARLSTTHWLWFNGFKLTLVHQQCDLMMTTMMVNILIYIEFYIELFSYPHTNKKYFFF